MTKQVQFQSPANQCVSTGHDVGSCWLVSDPSVSSFGIVQYPRRWCSLRRRNTGGWACAFAQKPRHWPHHGDQSAAQAAKKRKRKVFINPAVGRFGDNTRQDRFAVGSATIFTPIEKIGSVLMTDLWILLSCTVDEHVFSTRGEGAVGMATCDLLLWQKSVARHSQLLKHRFSFQEAFGPRCTNVTWAKKNTYFDGSVALIREYVRDQRRVVTVGESAPILEFAKTNWKAIAIRKLLLLLTAWSSFHSCYLAWRNT